MKAKWIFIIGILGFGVVSFGIWKSKHMASSFGANEINKTLSALEKLKKMQTEEAFDFQMQVLNLDSDNDAAKFEKLSDYKGKVILLNFWASWCEPCILEFPDMISLAEKAPEIIVIAVNRDKNAADALRFIKSFPEAKNKIHFYTDPNGDITSLYGTEVLPESYLIDKNFKVIRKVVGIEDWDHPSVIKFINTL